MWLWTFNFRFYHRRPVLASGYCRCLRLSVCVCVRQALACPRDNSRTVWARMTKFGPNMQNTLFKVPRILWSDRPWSSRSYLTWKSKFTPFWAYPHHNSSSIQARITKFWPGVQNNLVKIIVVLGGNWPWLSRSNLTQKSNVQVLFTSGNT